MPTTIAEHPQVFVTLTAPSFGAVHTTGDDRHGKPRSPLSRSRPPRIHVAVGTGNRCGAAPSTAIMMRVWVNRCAKTATTTPGTSCSPGTPPNCGGASPSPCADSWTATCAAIGEAAKSVRINYVKVAELQRRAIPHFHAVIRLDAPPVPGEPPTPPVSSITAADLAVLVQRAARAVTVTVTDPDNPGDGDGRGAAVRHPNRHPATAARPGAPGPVR